MWPEKITALIKDSLNKLGLPSVDFSVEHPSIESHGDYASNVAMVLYPILKQSGNTTYPNPLALATAIVSSLGTNHPSLITNISVAGPGFINFTISTKHYVIQLKELLEQNQQWGTTTTLSGKKVCVEYTDPNPFKELHLGHLFSNLIGEAIARAMEANGATVFRADFYGDTGLHVAKSVYGMLEKIHNENVNPEELASQPISARQAFLGQCYAYGVNQYESNEDIKTKIQHLNTLIYAVAQELHIENENWTPTVDYNKFINAPEFDRNEIKKMYSWGLKWSLEYFETLYKQLGTKFDGYYPESKIGEKGYQIVKDNIKDGIFEKSGETIIYPGEKYGLHTRVFINKVGLPTYEAKDIGLAFCKYEDFPYDLSINVTGSEIREYFKVVFDALKKINPQLGNATRALTHGMIRRPEGKMSSRTGNVITVEGLFAEAIAQAKTIITNDALTESEKDTIAQAVGTASIKYSLLKTEAGKDVVFDFNESVTFSGNSGPYLQYTVARCHSVLNKTNLVEFPEGDYIFNHEEIVLLKKLVELPEVISQTVSILSLHLLCQYCYELGSHFNTFYNTCPILGTTNKPLDDTTRKMRLALTRATQTTLTNALTILGIKCPEKM